MISWGVQHHLHQIPSLDTTLNKFRPPSNLKIGFTGAQIKVNLSLCISKYDAMKTYGGMEIHLNAFVTQVLNGGVASFKPRPLYHQRKSHRYPLDRMPNGPQSRFGCGAKKKTTFTATSGNRTSVIQPVATPAPTIHLNVILPSLIQSYN
jgi:hypothetical protein